MKLRTLELRNYRRHQRTLIEWPDGVIALLGRNGAGKSTILEAIGFALFGVPATRTGKDLLRWDGAGPMDNVWVALEFELGGEAIRIHRELRGKALTPNATLTVDGKVAVDPGAGSNEAVTLDVERRLGMDRDTFFTTLVAHQGDLDRLSEMTPAKRKQLLLEMLGIDALDRAIERARDRRRELEAKVDALRDTIPNPEKLAGAVDTAKQSLAEADNDHRIATDAWSHAKEALGKADAHWVKEQATAREWEENQREMDAAERDIERAEQQLEDARTQLTAAQTASARVEALAAVAGTYDECQTQLAAARQVQAEQLRLQSARHQLQQDEATLAELNATLPMEVDATQRATLDQELAENQRQLAVLGAAAEHRRRHLIDLDRLGDAADCPTCERPLAEHLPTLRSRMIAEQERDAAATKELEERRIEIAAALQEFDAAGAAHESAQKLMERIEQQRAALPPEPGALPDLAALESTTAAAKAAHEESLRLRALVDQIPGLRERMSAMESSHATSLANHTKAKAAQAKSSPPGAGFEAARKEHELAVATERDAERSVLAVQARIAVAQQALEHARSRRADAKKLGERLKEAEEEARYWAAIASGRGKGLLEAFKAHLVGRIGPAIAREASRLMERFTAGRYTEITLDSEYNVFVTDAGMRYTIDRFSGGESDLVHLALRLAVSRLLVERNNAEMRFLALDEVFGSLDDERRASVLAALQHLGGLYSQVLLVTHQDALRDALDAAMVVETVDGAARVTLHAG